METRPTISVHLLVWGLVGVALYLVGGLIESYPLRMAAKPLPMLALIAWTWLGAPSRTGRLVVGALCFGLLGDMLLELSSETFLFGLVSFLAGHIVYIVAFSRSAPSLRLGLAIPWALFTGAIYLVLGSQLGAMAVPVVAYMGAISAMAWRASAYAAERGGWALLAVLGAALFLFSDTLIAVDRFGSPIEGVRPAIILTYWLGQAGLAASIRRDAS